MLKRRIIAKLLIDSSGPAPQLVKFRRFTESRRIAGSPIATAKTLESQIVDEFLFCDLGTISPALVQEMSATLRTPLTVAGSIHTEEHADALFRTGGADKIVVKDLKVAETIAKRYGNQSVVWAVDYRGKCPTDVPDCAGEVLLTDILRDGMMCGMDLHAMDHAWKVPVVLCGGVGKLAHVKDALEAGADGVAISSMFAFTDKSPIKLRSWLTSAGANVRAA